MFLVLQSYNFVSLINDFFFPLKNNFSKKKNYENIYNEKHFTVKKNVKLAPYTRAAQ